MLSFYDSYGRPLIACIQEMHNYKIFILETLQYTLFVKNII